MLEPLGDQIRIDPIRELRRDLHMRPFEADRRVYLVFHAHLMNEDAADALLKDLEEPPDYATVVLVANELGPLPETIRSRCQLVPVPAPVRARSPRSSAARPVSTPPSNARSPALPPAASIASSACSTAGRRPPGGAARHRTRRLP